MDNFGSEIGQKMRSAVKAKLLELGTGGTTGYIDDELPDYVMIMVANKRSKQQMISDLNLFLGSQTELFVTWLHEVLQKLQEVTLPAASASKKRKSEDVVSKKDRKTTKKERKTSISKKSSEEAQSASVHHNEKAAASNLPLVPPINSITDVFADVLLEKAKKTLSTTAEAAAHIKKTKGNTKTTNIDATSASKPAEEKTEPLTDTITNKEQRDKANAGGKPGTNSKKKVADAITTTADREKDLAELAEIQKKIYAAKKHLQQLGEFDDDNSDYDEDFINLREDGTEDEDENTISKDTNMIESSQSEQKVVSKRKSPIIFDAGEKKRKDLTSTEKKMEDKNANFTPPPQQTNANNDRPGITGGRIQAVPKQNSPEREQYRERERERTRDPQRDKSRDRSSQNRSREREHDKRREQDRDRNKRETDTEAAKKTVHERLGLRQQTGRETQNPFRRAREDKQLFVPSYRRKENENERNRERDRERDRDREKEFNREREREKNREKERERDREREREREKNRGTERQRGRSEDRRKERDVEPERERNKEHAREQSREQIIKRKENETKTHRSISPVIRRTTTNTTTTTINDHHALPNITVSAVVKPNHNAEQSEIENDSEEASSTSTDSSSSDDSEESSDEEDNAQTPSSMSETQRQRIGSRVIVAPLKLIESSEEDEDKSLNSIIKIKPRTTVSPSKQACKTLLLRAVAEAQRSTNQKVRQKGQTAQSNQKGNIVIDENDDRKLYTKSYRERLKRKATSSSSTSNLFRRATQNLVIKVERDMPLDKRRCKEFDDDIEDDEVEHGDIEKGEEKHVENKYLSGTKFQRVNTTFVPKAMRVKNLEQNSSQIERASEDNEDDETESVQGTTDTISERKTQFVVTLNDERTAMKYMSKTTHNRSESPFEQVTSSSSGPRFKRVEASSATQSKLKTQQIVRRQNARSNIKSRLSTKVGSTSHVLNTSDRESSNSLPTTPPLRRGNFGPKGNFRKSNEVKKIIINNDTDDEEINSKKLSSSIVVGNDRQRKHKRTDSDEELMNEERSSTPPPPRKSDKALEKNSPPKRKRTLSNSQRDGKSGDLDCYEVDEASASKRRSKSDEDSGHDHGQERERKRERELDDVHAVSRDYSADRHSGEERRKISTRNFEAKKYDNIPSLSSVALDSATVRVLKTKERCKYHPNCTKKFCDYYHPTAPCKSFPNCKYAEKCLYSHPHCKYDLSCTNLDCNYAHSGPRDPAQLVPQAPPLSSHVVPVQNYKSISATTSGLALCKYYPTCSKVGCTFYHPKQCKYGKNCINKLECSFYHHEVQSSNKFKWVASVV